MYVSNHTINIFGITRRNVGTVNTKYEFVQNYFEEDIGDYNNTIIMYKEGFLDGHYITIHINNVPKLAFEYYMNNDFENLYNIRSYNQNIGNYYDAKIIDAFTPPTDPNDYSQPKHPFQWKKPLLYLYSVMLAHKVQEDVYRFVPNVSYYENDLKNQDAIEKNLFYSRLSMLYEIVLKSYTMESIFDHTKETEVFIFSRIYLPVFVNDVLKYIKFAEYGNKTELTNPNDTIFSTNNSNYISYLLRPNNVNVNEGRNPVFISRDLNNQDSYNNKILDEMGCCSEINLQDLCGKMVEFSQDSEKPILLFFRILKQTDGIKTQNTTVLRSKTSFILDNSAFNINEMFNFDQRNIYVLEMYYDSYFAIVRDKKDYCFSVMLNNALSSDSILYSDVSIKDVFAIFYERHIHTDKKAFCDHFFISTGNNNMDYASFYNGFTTADREYKITYLALSPIIKNFIFYYHDDKPVDKLSSSECQKEKCRNKVAFLFLTKRMYYDGQNQYVVRHDDSLDKIEWLPHRYTNTFIMKEVKELSGLLRFLAAIHLGFKPFMYIDKTFKEENNFRKIKTKSIIDYPSDPVEFRKKRKTYLNMKDLPVFLELEGASKIVLYHIMIDGQKSLVYNILRNEIVSKNIFEAIYNTYYEKESLNARYFRYDISMDEMIKIISCGNMLCYVNDFKDKLSVWFYSMFFKEFFNLQDSSISLARSTSPIGEGGIILFLNYVEEFILPFKKVYTSEQIVKKFTGEEEPILLVNDANLRRKVLDKRLYAFGLPNHFLYSYKQDKIVPIGGSPFMMTYTDRHYHVVIREGSKNKIKYGIMIDLSGENKDLYKIAQKVNNGELFFYYKKECNNSQEIKAIRKIEDILDMNFISKKIIKDDFFYEVMGTNTSININEFYPQDFYNNYIADNISKLRIPIIIRELVPNDIYEDYKKFSLMQNRLIYSLPSVFEEYDTFLVDKREFLEYSKKYGVYFREVLYNKYIRSIIIEVHSALYRKIATRNFEDFNFFVEDFRFSCSFEIKTKREIVDMLEDINQINLVNDNLATVSNDMPVVLARANLTLPSANFGIIDQTNVFIYI